MSTIANVLVSAAVVIGIGGAVVATSVADPSEPPRVGDPVILQQDQSDPARTSKTGEPNRPESTAAPDKTPRPTGPGNDPDDDPDDDAADDPGRIDDDGVDEVFPTPRTLDDDDPEDGGADDADDKDDRDGGADDRGGD
jgi:hypothetical protein